LVGRLADAVYLSVSLPVCLRGYSHCRDQVAVTSIPRYLVVDLSAVTNRGGDARDKNFGRFLHVQAAKRLWIWSYQYHCKLVDQSFVINKDAKESAVKAGGVKM